jgi:hypothetical protein
MANGRLTVPTVEIKTCGAVHNRKLCIMSLGLNRYAVYLAHAFVDSSSEM